MDLRDDHVEWEWAFVALRRPWEAIGHIAEAAGGKSMLGEDKVVGIDLGMGDFDMQRVLDLVRHSERGVRGMLPQHSVLVDCLKQICARFVCPEREAAQAAMRYPL